MNVYPLTSGYKVQPTTAPKNRAIIAEVVIIDQIDPARPKVYLLADEVSFQLESGAVVDELFLQQWGDLFIEVGTAQEINRKKRSVILETEDIMFCKHLIIAKGDPQASENQEAFAPGLHALSAALKLRKEKLLSMYPESPAPSKHKCRAELENSDKQETLSLLKLAADTLCQKESKPNLSARSHRFFEVLP